jgi:amidase
MRITNPCAGRLTRRLTRASALVVASAVAAGMMIAMTASSAQSSSVSNRTPGGLNLEVTTIPQLENAMDAGRLTSVQLTRFYLARIRRLNPKLHAVITTNPDAVREATASDRRRAAHQVRGPLEGVAVLLKDNIDTHDQE